MIHRLIVLTMMLVLLLGTSFSMMTPVDAAQGATIVSTGFDPATCVFTVTFLVEDAGMYAVNMWDDGNFRAGAGGAFGAGTTNIVQFTVGGIILQGAAGIGIYVEDGVGLAATTTYDANGNGQFWTDAQGADCLARGFTWGAAVYAPSVTVPGITDGRLCFWEDYAVYTTGEVIDVYGIWEKEGYFVLRVTQEELDAAPGAEGVNTLIASSADGNVQVYRLETTDVFQVHAGLDFVRFRGLPASGVVCGTVELP